MSIPFIKGSEPSLDVENSGGIKEGDPEPNQKSEDSKSNIINWLKDLFK
jgi:hypothetical protein